MSTTYQVTTEPSGEPITLDELKNRLRILTCDFDLELTQILTAARKAVELDTKRALMTQTIKLWMDEFPIEDEIKIRIAPVQSITSVKYYDLDGVFQTFSTDNYWTDLISTPCEIELRQSKLWPETQLEKPNAVVVEFVAGYGAASAVPVAAKLAIVEYARSIWNNCEGRTEQYKRLVSMIEWTAVGIAQ